MVHRSPFEQPSTQRQKPKHLKPALGIKGQGGSETRTCNSKSRPQGGAERLENGLSQAGSGNSPLGRGSSFLLRRPKIKPGRDPGAGKKTPRRRVCALLFSPFISHLALGANSGGSEWGVDPRGWIPLSKPPLRWEGQQR